MLLDAPGPRRLPPSGGSSSYGGFFLGGRTEEPSLRIWIDEGKNRQIQGVLSALGLSVLKLRRVATGAFEPGALPLGGHRFLSKADQAGLLTSSHAVGESKRKAI